MHNLKTRTHELCLKYIDKLGKLTSISIKQSDDFKFSTSHRLEDITTNDISINVIFKNKSGFIRVDTGKVESYEIAYMILNELLKLELLKFRFTCNNDIDIDNVDESNINLENLELKLKHAIDNEEYEEAIKISSLIKSCK